MPVYRFVKNVVWPMSTTLQKTRLKQNPRRQKANLPSYHCLRMIQVVSHQVSCQPSMTGYETLRNISLYDTVRRAHLFINDNVYFIPQYLPHHMLFLAGSNTWKIILFDSRKSTHPGQLCISSNQIEGYVLSIASKKYDFYMYTHSGLRPRARHPLLFHLIFDQQLENSQTAALIQHILRSCFLRRMDNLRVAR